jgi:hypothetical protein
MGAVAGLNMMTYISSAMRPTRRQLGVISATIFVVVLFALPSLGAARSISQAVAFSSAIKPGTYGELDCNGQSTLQHSVRPNMLCTDIRGFAGVTNKNNWGNRFYDNGLYIGHDEPDMTFLSNQSGSGANVVWTETLGSDPSAAPTVAHPGHDVSHWFELSPAPWFSMAMCDSNSYPQLPCSPQSDANAPLCNAVCGPGGYPGAGSAFMEMQFYPPGFAPFADSTSCDNSHWCGALNIDSLECTYGFSSCNGACEEPVNFAFIQTNGVPAGPPSPQLSNLSTYTPNSATLLMNPGDRVSVHMFDAPLPGGGGRAFEVVVNDLTTGQSGWMQASAANGFMHTSITDCSGTAYNFEPEYSSASRGNIVPWAALQTDVSTEYETGHFEPCSALRERFTISLGAGVTDVSWDKCLGVYENSAPGGDNSTSPEAGDALCYPINDTHGALASAPDTITGCTTGFVQNGDLDFEGSPYWSEWPMGSAATAKYPASFVQSFPTSAGRDYQRFYLQTDVALSESTCNSTANWSGCTVPPVNAPGAFYPFWSLVKNAHGVCSIEFGNVASGPGVDDMGADLQYGTDQIFRIGYPEFESPLHGLRSC